MKSARFSCSTRGLLTFLGMVWLGAASSPTISASANLRPYSPLGPPAWSAEVVVSTNSTAVVDSSPLLSNDTFYVTWAVANYGDAPAAAGFKVALYVDDILRVTWVAGQLPSLTYTWAEPHYPIGFLTSGTHTLRVVADPDGVVPESDETDNEYTKTIVVTQARQIRIEPLTVTFSGSLSPSSLAVAPADSSLAAAESVDAALGLDPAADPSEKTINPQRIEAELSKAATVRVMVKLAAPAALIGPNDLSIPATVKALQPEMRRLQDEVLDGMPASDLTVRVRFQNLPAFSADVSPAGLLALQSDPRVASIEPVRTLEPHLAQGIPAIHGIAYRGSDHGSGMSIAICDTGIDYRHPLLGNGTFPNDKVLGGYDFGDGDSDPMAHLGAHGTACAGIAAGDLGSTGDYIGGVAYGAKLYALKISVSPVAPATAELATSETMAAAWDWCVQHKNDHPEYPILVISTSFGGGRHFSACDAEEPVMAAAANNAVAAGITILASSGNDGYCDSIGAPACLSSVVAVGATYDASFGNFTPCLNESSCASKTATAGCESGWYSDDPTALDRVTAYSNMSPQVRLLAPGNQCSTLDNVGTAGYGPTDYNETFGGTSAACPYVAGSVASLQSAAKRLIGRYLSVTEVISELTSSGDLLTDAKSGIAKPRVNLERAIESLLGTGKTFRIYNDGPLPLTVLSISTETTAPWLNLTPTGPFDIPGGLYQNVTVAADFALASAGQSTVRLLVESSDSTQTPYPGGVFVVVNNTPPTISNLPDQTTTAGVATPAIPFTIGDSELTAASLTLAKTSTDTTLVPLDNIVFGGSGSSRTVTVTPAPNRTGTCSITITVGDGSSTATDSFTLSVDSGVVGRYIFYNQSAFDGNNAAANAADDGAIAPDKIALRPGQTATFTNYTSYSRGLNGVMIDIDGLPGIPDLSDFTFRVGNNNNPAGWATAPDPTISVRQGSGSGGADRITLIWPNNAVQKRWLQVTVKATGHTALSAPDVFYFGNAIGECGNAANAVVNVNDVVLTRSHPRSPLNLAPIDYLYDHNRDRVANVTDVVIARSNQTSPLTMLQWIAAP